MTALMLNGAGIIMSRCRLYVFALLLWLLNSVTLSQACPAACTCTGVKVDCYGRDLMEIPTDIPPEVVHLDLQNNHISSLDPSRLQNLSNLQDLSLRYNKLQDLPDGAFSNLPSLRHLQLGNNQLTSFNKDAFANLPSLSILEANENQLTSIDGAFDNIPSLTRLVLTRNALTNLTDSALAPLTHLVYLMLSENKISYISPTAFYTLDNLSYLTLRDNPLRNIDNVLSHNTQLAYLDLTNCTLQAIPQGLPWTTRYLQLAQNNIIKISKDSFQKTHYLGILILDENHISHIEPGALLPLAYLHQLWLNGNNLDTFPSPIPPSVNTLCIDKNFIQNISNHDFPSHSELKLLSLKGNKIGSLDPYTFASLGSLQKLYLSSNSIAHLKDRAFLGLRNLTVLDIGRNPITHIETRFAAGLQNLQELDLSFVEDTEPILQGNFFRDVPYMTSLDLRFSPSLAKNIMGSVEMVKSLYNLKTLNLMDNQLQALELDLPRYFPHLHTIKLSGNPWRCNQQLVWLNDWIQRQRNLFADAQDIVCFLPSHLRGRAVADLPAADFFYTTVSTMTSTQMPEDHGSEGLEVVTSGGYHTEPFHTPPLTSASQVQSSDLAKSEPTASLLSSSLSTGYLNSDVSLAQQNSTSPTKEFPTLPTMEFPTSPTTEFPTLPTMEFPTSSTTEFPTLPTMEFPTSPVQSSIGTSLSPTLPPSFVSDTDSTITFTTNKTVRPAQNPTATVPTLTSIKTTTVKPSIFSVTFSKHQSSAVPTTIQKDEQSLEPQNTAETSLNSSFSSTRFLLQRSTYSITAPKEDLQTSHPASQTGFTNKTKPTETSTIQTSPSTIEAANTATLRTSSMAGTTMITAATSTVSSTSTITYSNNTDQGTAAKEETQPQSTLQPVTPSSSSSSSQPKTMVPSVAFTDRVTSSSKTSQAATTQKQSKSSENSTIASPPSLTGMSEVSTESEPTPNPTTGTPASITPSDTSSIQINPASTGIPQTRPKGSRLPSLSEASSNTRMIITATSVTILCLIIGLLLAAFLKRHRGQIKRLYHHAMSYTIETGDTAFVLSDQDDPDMVSGRELLGERQRSEVDSSGSRQSLDNCQENDAAMNGFAWSKLE